MKEKLLMVCSLLFAVHAVADGLAFAPWQKDGIDVYVSAIDWNQFKGSTKADGRMLVPVVWKALWESYTEDQREAIGQALKKFEGGTIKLKNSNLPKMKAEIIAAGVDCLIVGPDDSPVFGSKFYIFRIINGKNTEQRLVEFGIIPVPVSPPS